MLKGWYINALAAATILFGVGCGAAPSGVASTYGSGPIIQALSRTDNYFITQYHHTRYNPAETGESNANCGPTSLAMALKAFGRAPTNLNDAPHAQALIRYVRQVMTGSDDETTWTYPSQVLDGARRMGLNGQMVHSLDAIREVMAEPGHLVVVNLNPSPAYAFRLVYPYDGGHFALLTGIHGNEASLNDPLARGPFTISLDQLETALTSPLRTDASGNVEVPAFDGGVALWL